MIERAFQAEIAKCNKRIARIGELMKELPPESEAYGFLVRRRTEWLRYRAALASAKSKAPKGMVWGKSAEI